MDHEHGDADWNCDLILLTPVEASVWVSIGDGNNNVHDKNEHAKYRVEPEATPLEANGAAKELNRGEYLWDGVRIEESYVLGQTHLVVARSVEDRWELHEPECDEDEQKGSNGQLVHKSDELPAFKLAAGFPLSAIFLSFGSCAANVSCLAVHHNESKVGEHQQNVGQVGQKLPKSIRCYSYDDQGLKDEVDHADKAHECEAAHRDLRKVALGELVSALLLIFSTQFPPETVIALSHIENIL